MGFLWIPQGENQWISTDEKKDFGDQKLRVWTSQNGRYISSTGLDSTSKDVFFIELVRDLFDFLYIIYFILFKNPRKLNNIGGHYRYSDARIYCWGVQQVRPGALHGIIYHLMGVTVELVMDQWRLSPRVTTYWRWSRQWIMSTWLKPLSWFNLPLQRGNLALESAHGVRCDHLRRVAPNWRQSCSGWPLARVAGACFTSPLSWKLAQHLCLQEGTAWELQTLQNWWVKKWGLSVAFCQKGVWDSQKHHKFTPGGTQDSQTWLNMISCNNPTFEYQTWPESCPFGSRRKKHEKNVGPLPSTYTFWALQIPNNPHLL